MRHRCRLSGAAHGQLPVRLGRHVAAVEADPRERRPELRRALGRRLESAIEPNSSWNVSAIFAPQNQPKVEAALREELALSIKEGFTPEGTRRGPRRPAQPAPPGPRPGRQRRQPARFRPAPRPQLRLRPAHRPGDRDAEPGAGQRRLAQVHRPVAGGARLGRRLQGGALGGRPSRLGARRPARGRRRSPVRTGCRAASRSGRRRSP